jgi:hypothetical protein
MLASASRTSLRRVLPFSEDGFDVVLSTQAFYYTEPALARLFAGWDDVRLVEKGLGIVV